jgi:hypothetical protein
MEEKKPFTQRVVAELVKRALCSAEESKNIITTFEESAIQHFDAFLLEEGLVQKAQLLNILAKVYETPAFDVTGYFFDHELLLLFPKDFLLENLFIPLKADDETLFIIMNDPENLDVVETIGNYVSYNVDIQVGLAKDIERAIEEYYNLDIVSESMEEEFEDDEEEMEDADIVDFM